MATMEHEWNVIETMSDESWVDLSKPSNSLTASTVSKVVRQRSDPLHSSGIMAETPDRVTPLPTFANGEEYLRLLREAQKESNQSSARVSHTSSRKDSPKGSGSPKSPPNSPNTELLYTKEDATLKGVYINYYNNDGEFVRVEKNTETDWIWDWSSRPDQRPPKEWKFVHPPREKSGAYSIRRAMVGKSSLFSRDVLYTLLITNVLSLLLGTGIGIWLSKKSGGTVTINAVPLN